MARTLSRSQNSDSSNDSIDYSYAEGDQEEHYALIDHIEKKFGIQIDGPTTSSSSLGSTTSTSASYGSGSDISNSDSGVSMDHSKHHVIPCNRGGYCLECGERELDEELRRCISRSNHIYENCRRVDVVDEQTELYGMYLNAKLLVTVLTGLRDKCSNRQMKELQKRMQKAIFLANTVDLSACSIDNFPEKCRIFASLVERRMRVIRDYSLDAYLHVAKRVDGILTDAQNGRLTRLDKIRSSFRRVLRR